MDGFNLILSGDLDHLPEQAFYLVGKIDEAIGKSNFFKRQINSVLFFSYTKCYKK